MNPLLRCLLSVLALCLPIHAADHNQLGMASIRLIAFSRVGDDMEVNITGADGSLLSKTPVSLPTQQLSPVESVSTRSLIFTSKADPKKILGKVELPTTGGEYVLIFLPAGKGAAAPYHIDPVPLPSSSFKSGDYAFLNYCGDPVGCDIAGKRMIVPNGKSAVYQSLDAGKSAGNRSLLCYRQKDGQWESTPIYSIRIIVQEGVRNLVFIFRNPSNDQIDFRGVSDFVE